jgi:hypothetical protein
MPLSNYLAPSAIAKPGVCTSSTRPASPYAGQFIWESDTQKLLVWDGAAWYPPKNDSWGVLGISESTSAFATSATHTTFQDTGLSVSVSYGPSRRIKITAQLRPYPNGGLQFVEYRFVRGSTNIVIAAYGTCDLSASEAPTKTYSYTFSGPSTAATETFKVQMRGTSANTQVTDYATGTDGPRQLVIEDVGPA